MVGSRGKAPGGVRGCAPDESHPPAVGTTMSRTSGFDEFHEQSHLLIRQATETAILARVLAISRTMT